MLFLEEVSFSVINILSKPSSKLQIRLTRKKTATGIIMFLFFKWLNFSAFNFSDIQKSFLSNFKDTFENESKRTNIQNAT